MDIPLVTDACDDEDIPNDVQDSPNDVQGNDVAVDLIKSNYCKMNWI